MLAYSADDIDGIAAFRVHRACSLHLLTFVNGGRLQTFL